MAGEPLRSIAKRYGTSPTSLFRHKQADIPATLVQAKQAEEEVRAETLFERLRAINRETQAILEEARESGSLSIALAAINRVERQLEFEARLLGQLNDATRVAVGVNVIEAKPEFDFYGLSNEELAAEADRVAERLREMAGLNRPA